MLSTPKRLAPGCDSSSLHLVKRYRQDNGTIRNGLLSSEEQQLSSYSRAKSEDSPATISPSDEGHLICFGMLCNVQIQLNAIQPEHLLNLKTLRGDNESFKIFDVSFDRAHCIIQTPNATPIALLNIKTHKALTIENIDSSSLFCIALVRQENLEQGLTTLTSTRSSKSHKTTCSMDMIVCGPQQTRDTLSRSLSKSRLFLQHPRLVPDHTVYDNPHYLGLPGSKLSEGAVLRPLMLDSTILAVQQKSVASYESAQVVDAEDILSHITVQSDLKEAEIDDCLVKTKLLRHQKEGVDFILRRETPAPDDPNSLWRRHYSFESHPLYHHRVSGTRSQIPRDSPGGIIADDMGLGKTLTMICAIVSSLRRGIVHSEVPFPSVPNSYSRRIATESTLVILPSACEVLLNTWISELTKHVVEGNISYYKYHGPARRLDVSKSLPYDVVLTTYTTVAADYSRGGGVLDEFHWYRLVLDEAHFVRNSATRQFQATMHLSAKIRWCMTGTPIQNSIDDLASLLRFLRIPLLEDAATFRKHIIGQTKVPGAVSKEGLENLKLVLRAICIRRGSSHLATIGVVPKDIRIDLTTMERAAYDSIGKAMRNSLDAAVSSRKSRGASQAILRGILKLRQSCNNGEQQAGSSATSKYNLDEKISLLEQSSETSCVFCEAPVLVNGQIALAESPHLTSCDRLVCGSCVPKLCSEMITDEQMAAEPCAICGTGHDKKNQLAELSQSLPDTMPKEYRAAPPSKLLALFNDVMENYAEEKCVIFTYWISTLDIIERMFQQKAISFRRIDGTLSTPQRTERLSQFHQDSSVRILMMTLGTGAVGLNDLSVASRLHLVEPQWNPSVEKQAIGRVVRLGQDRQVTVIRYITNNTIEESVQSRQLQKLKLAFDGDLRTLDPHGETNRATQFKELESLLKIQS